MDSVWNDEPLAPLKGIRVLDLTVMLTGPYFTRILAQSGADVVKIEKTEEGDTLRLPGAEALFSVLNQGKRSLSVDLKSPEGQELIKKLATEADVLVENFRDGVLERLGLGYSVLTTLNPNLIYCSLRGFGGNDSGNIGHDLNFVAASGVGEWFLESKHPNYSAFFGDVVGGVLVPVIRLLAHLANPNRTGMHLVSYMDAGFRSLYVGRAREHASQAKGPTWTERLFGGTLPSSRFYQCADGWVSLQALQSKDWELFCEVVARPQWKGKEQDPTLTPEVAAWFQEKKSKDVETLLLPKNVCFYRVIPWDEFFNTATTQTQLASDPLAWAGFSPCPKIRPAPKCGEHTYELLLDLGLANKEIAELLAKKVVHAEA